MAKYKAGLHHKLEKSQSWTYIVVAEMNQDDVDRAIV